MPTREQIIEKLETVIDPELDIDIWTMGLVYEVNVLNESTCHIVMTFTTPACPLGPVIISDIKKSLALLGLTDIKVEVTFDPPWTPPEELRDMLGL